MAGLNERIIFNVSIDHNGYVLCGTSTERKPICYKWRSGLACKECPMQKLMYRSQLNEKAFSVDY